MSNPTYNRCGGLAFIGETNPQEVQVIIENSRLKDELERISTIAGKFMGHPLSNMMSSFNSVGGASNSSLVNNQWLVASSNSNGNLGVDGSFRRFMLELAMASMNELMKLAQMEEPLWMKDGGNGREILDFEEYGRRFVRCIGPKPDEYVVEASRESGVVAANTIVLVETLMDANHWADMFPCLISKSTTTDVISSGLDGTRNGALQFMHASLQVMSPLVPTREAYFLRFCKQHANGIWVIVDVSSDEIHEFPTTKNGYMSCRRLPSGCVLQDMPNGYSKIGYFY